MDALKEVQIPVDVSEAFLANIAYCTSLTPRNLQVQDCCSMLEEICPALFETEEAPDTTKRSGTKSPVCVEDELVSAMTHSSRKRPADRDGEAIDDDGDTVVSADKETIKAVLWSKQEAEQVSVPSKSAKKKRRSKKRLKTSG
jgi:hypothetical protein